MRASAVRIGCSLIALTVSLVLHAPRAAAQGAGETRQATPGSASSGFRLSVGVGGGALGSGSGGHAARITIGGLTESGHIFSFRATKIEEVVLFRSPAESAWDVGVLYGRRARAARGHASISAGLAVVGGVRRGARIDPFPDGCSILPFCLIAALDADYQREEFTTFGVPFEAEAVWAFARRWGVGLSAFGNLNAEMSTIGASLSILHGALR